MVRALAVALAMLSLGACQHSAPAPELSAASQAASGEISFMGTGASFDGSHVVGARVNLSRRSDGSWGGLMMDQPVDVSISGKRVSGVNLTMSFTQTSEGTLIQGQWLGRILRFEINQNEAIIRTPTRSLTLRRNANGSYGPNSELTMKGDATKLNPPLPQFAFAMAATF